MVEVKYYFLDAVMKFLIVDKKENTIISLEIEIVS